MRSGKKATFGVADILLNTAECHVKNSFNTLWLEEDKGERGADPGQKN